MQHLQEQIWRQVEQPFLDITTGTGEEPRYHIESMLKHLTQLKRAIAAVAADRIKFRAEEDAYLKDQEDQAHKRYAVWTNAYHKLDEPQVKERTVKVGSVSTTEKFERTSLCPPGFGTLSYGDTTARYFGKEDRYRGMQLTLKNGVWCTSNGKPFKA